MNSSIMQSNWSTRFAAVFMGNCILPRVVASSSVISRVLLQTALLFSEKYSSVVVENLLVPLMNSKSFKSAQGEAVTRILREGLQPTGLSHFLHCVLTYRHSRLSQSGGPKSPDSGVTLGNEVALLVVQNVLNLKIQLSKESVDVLVEIMEENLETHPELTKSLKFGTLVFTLVSKYPQQVSMS
jgi:hypothetical protein